MAVAIRLAKIGRKGESRYHIVVAEKRTRRNGKPIETLGWLVKKVGEQIKKINKQRYDYWISQGAAPSETVSKLINS